MKRFQILFIIALILLLFVWADAMGFKTVAHSPNVSTLTQAQQPNTNTLLAQGGSWEFLRPRRGRSKNTSAGTRSPCDLVDNESELSPIPLTPLIPSWQSETPSSSIGNNLETLGITVSDHPTFWIYVPQPSSKSDGIQYDALFAYKDEIPMHIKLPNASRIIHFQSPTTLPLNEPKQWFFSILCHERQESRNPTVMGWIERQERQSESDFMTIEQASSLSSDQLWNLIDDYFSRGIWHEGLTLLAKYRCKNPQDSRFNEDWDRLFQDASRFAETGIERIDHSVLFSKKPPFCE
jgi:hypothetical protein